MENDNLRQRLTIELQKDKEEKLQKQKEFYENKINKLKQKGKNIFRRKEKTLEIKTPLELLKEKEKGGQEVAEYKRRKFQISPTGKIYRATTSPIRYLYGRSYNYKRPKYKRNLPPSRYRYATRPRFASSPQQSNNEYNQIFWSYPAITQQLEAEVSNQGSGEAWAGSKVANQIGKEAGFFGNFLLPPHSVNVDREAQIHSNLVNFNPALALEKEINIYANILNPVVFKRKV